MNRLSLPDTRFLGLALLLHALVLWGGSGFFQKARFGMAAEAGAVPTEASPKTFGAPDLEADLGDEAWAAPAPKPVPRPEVKPQASGKGQAQAKPGFLLNPPPPYPEEARLLGEEGRVLLRLEVGASGEVAAVRVLKSSGYPLLDDSALKTLKKWKFKPALLAGEPVASTLDVPIQFDLKAP